MAEPARQAPPPRDAGLLLGRFFGVPVYLSLSWLVIAAIITFSYADLVRERLGLTSGAAYLVAFGMAVLLAVSLLAHELGHVAMCLALGIGVRRVVIFILGGVSEIEGEPRRPGDDYLIAMAGPLVTLLLAGGSGALYRLAEPDTVLSLLLGWLAVGNLVVLAFNLLPGLPLDGGKVLRAGVWRVTGSRLTGTRAAAWCGRGLAALVVVGAVFFARGEDDFAAAVTNMAVALMVAAFIWVGASQALTVAAIHSRLPTLRVADLVRPALAVPANLPVSEALRRAWETRSQGLVVVDGDGRPAALVSEAHVLALPEQRRPWTTVAEVSRQLEPGLTLSDSAAGEAVLDAVRAHPASEYLVVGGDGRPVGVLATTDVAVLLRRWGTGGGATGGSAADGGGQPPAGAGR